MSGTTFASYGIDIPPGASGEVDVLCPQCSHTRKKSRDKCLSVNVELGTWQCHHTHCGWSGGLSTMAGSIPIINRRQPIYEHPRPLPSVIMPTLWEKAVAWFAARGISEPILHQAGVTTSDEFCPVCEKPAGNILFPYYRGGQHVNTKHRCGKKHFRMEKGAERILYGLDGLDGLTVVIVEGEIDKLSLDEAGIAGGLSVPDGAPALDAKSYASKFSFLESAEDVFTAATKVILATDADAPGQKLAEELARRIGPEKCWRVNWQDAGVKDANECLAKFGPELLALAVEAAVPYPVEGIYTGHDLVHDLERMLIHGIDRGVGCGPPVLSAHYRVKTGQMTVVTGISSHGKTSVLDQFLMWLAQEHGWTFTLFSPEQQPLTFHQRNLIELHAGRAFWDPDNPFPVEEMRQHNAWVADRFSFILPESPNVDEIIRLAKIEVFRKGVRGIVIDPYNELEHTRPRHLSETEYVSSLLSQFRRLAIHQDLHIWLLAHPTKMRLTESGAEPIPTLWDISGSANFRNKADIGLTVWRDIANESNEVDVLVTKMRWLDTGKPGRIRFRYDPNCKRLTELGIVDADGKPA